MDFWQFFKEVEHWCYHGRERVKSLKIIDNCTIFCGSLEPLSSSTMINSSSELSFRVPLYSSDVLADFMLRFAGKAVLLRSRELIWMVLSVVRGCNRTSSLVSSVGFLAVVIFVSDESWCRLREDYLTETQIRRSLRCGGDVANT